MAVNLSPVVQDAQFTSAGALLNGGFIYSYAAGSSTPLATYTDNTGATPQANPITLNARGEVASPIWLTAGLGYKLRLFDASNNFIREFDNVKGVNDTTLTIDQWLASGLTPTYVSATQFTLAGDQTSNFTVNRRLKSTITAGTAYSTITASVFTTLTTVTVANDSTALDSGLSAVSYGILTPTNTSYPKTLAASGANSDITSLSACTQITGLTTALTTAQGGTGAKTGAILRSYLAGLTLSTAGSSATMSIAAGQATDSTNVDLLTLAAIAKTTSAWAVGTGNGGLDTGAIANSTWYHFYAIRRPDTGVVDAISSLSASAPTLPANYTQYRRIGSGKTNGSAQWTGFTQSGNVFQWLAPTASVNTTNPGVAAVLPTVDVPLGVAVQAALQVYVNNGTTVNIIALLTDPALTDTAPTSAAFSLITNAASAANFASGEFVVGTDTSSRIRYRLSASGASDVIRINTKGWIDLRGQNN